MGGAGLSPCTGALARAVPDRSTHRMDLSSMLSSMEHNLDLNERRPCRAESRVGVLHVVLAVVIL